MKNFSSLVILAFSALTSTFLLGDTIYVKETNTGTRNGTSWATAYTSVQTALAFSSPGDQIWVAKGTYYPDEGFGQTNSDTDASFEMRDDVDLYGGFSGSEQFLSERILNNTNRTILSGDLNQDDDPNDPLTFQLLNSTHVVTVENTTNTTNTTINGFTIEAGYRIIPDATGAGMVISSSIIVENCVFLNNTSIFGGAVSINYPDPAGSVSPAKFLNCRFIDNTSFTDINGAGAGGAVYITGESNSTSGTEFTDCIFTSNSTDNVLTGTPSTNNGGAVYHTGTATFTNCSFLGNEGNNGGACACFSGTSLFVNSIFSGNAATEAGGACYFSDNDHEITNCSFQGNAAILGGGGAIAAINSDGELKNSIIWNNASAGFSDDTSTSSLLVIGSIYRRPNSMVQHFPAIDGTISGTITSNNPRFFREVDPLTAPHTDGDLRLKINSPMLDLGDSSLNTTTEDLAGNVRVQGSSIDVGAYEGGLYNSFELLYPELSPDDDENNNGNTNFEDYALGNDPYSTSPVTRYPRIEDNAIRMSYRTNAEDFRMTVEISDTLELNSWTHFSDVLLPNAPQDFDRGISGPAINFIDPKKFYRVRIDAVE